jgi:hypothetical protein
MTTATAQAFANIAFIKYSPIYSVELTAKLILGQGLPPADAPFSENQDKTDRPAVNARKEELNVEDTGYLQDHV